MSRTTHRYVVAALATLSFAGVAAGSAAATTAPPEDMTAAGPAGPLCAAVPADGEGSVAGMADDAVGTAASNNPLLTTLVAAVTAADLGDTFNGPGPFTVFAPVNSAFDKVDPVHTKGSYHYRNQAIDVSGDPKAMRRFNRRVAQLYGIR